jgi:hypothetical protein
VVARAEPTDVTDEAPVNSFGVRLGAVFVQGPPEGGAGVGGGLFFLHDRGSLLVDASVDAHFGPRDAADGTVGLGAYYALSRTDDTLYVGGGFRYGGTKYDYSCSGGLFGVASVGFLARRRSTVVVRGELSVMRNQRQSTDCEGGGGGGPSFSVTAAVATSIGLGF